MRRGTDSSRRKTAVRISSCTSRISRATGSRPRPRMRRSSTSPARARRARRRRTSSLPARRNRAPAPSFAAAQETIQGALIAGKEDKIEFEGEVIEAFRNGMYKILLDNGNETLGYTAGKMRRYRIKILPGDRVNVELSPYDLSRGRIVYRHR